MDGFIALCAVLGKVRTVRLADCGLGASSVAELSKIFSDTTAALNLLTVDSTGVPKLTNQYADGYAESGPRTYTLTVGEKTIDLSSRRSISASTPMLLSRSFLLPRTSKGMPAKVDEVDWSIRTL